MGGESRLACLKRDELSTRQTRLSPPTHPPQSLAVNGPTQGAAIGGSLPPFEWAQFPNTPHAGLPPIYDFNFAEQQPWVA